MSIRQSNTTLANQMRSDTALWEYGVTACGDTQHTAAPNWTSWSPKISFVSEFDWWLFNATLTFLHWSHIVSNASIKCGYFHVKSSEYEVFLPGIYFWQGGKSSQSASAVDHFLTLKIAQNKTDGMMKFCQWGRVTALTFSVRGSYITYLNEEPITIS